VDTGSRQEQAQITHSRAALELARARYTDGLVDFLTVLDAERTLLQAEQQYATSTSNVSLDLVQLFKAPSKTAAAVIPLSVSPVAQ
jgi:outer membrane protein TolC